MQEACFRLLCRTAPSTANQCSAAADLTCAQWVEATAALLVLCYVNGVSTKLHKTHRGGLVRSRTRVSERYHGHRLRILYSAKFQCDYSRDLTLRARWPYLALYCSLTYGRHSAMPAVPKQMPCQQHQLRDPVRTGFRTTTAALTICHSLLRSGGGGSHSVACLQMQQSHTAAGAQAAPASDLQAL